MTKFTAKFKKLITKPRLFFRDAMINRTEFANLEKKIIEEGQNLVPQTQSNIKKVTRAPIHKKIPAQQVFCENFQSIEHWDTTFLFESYSGSKISCNPYFIYRELRKDPDFKNCQVVWVKTAKTIVPDDIQNDKNVVLVEYMSSDYAIALSKAKYLVNNWIFPSYFIKRDDQFYMNVWHGIPLKHMGLDIGPMGFENGPPLANSGYIQRNFLQCNTIPLASKYSQKAIVDAYGAATVNQDKVVFTGSARLDGTLNTDSTLIREKLNIESGKQVLLVAPTWRGRFGAISMEIDQQLDLVDLINQHFGDHFHVLFSIHHSVKTKLKEMPSRNEVNFIPDGIDINEILSCVDILISDYSSITLDFLVLDKPIVLFVPDREVYESEHGLYIQLEELPVTIIDDKTKLVEAVSSFKKPSQFDNYKNAIAKFIPYEDGKSAFRVLELFKDNIVKKDKIKKRILIYPGALFNNGITTSFLSLMDNIDYDEYDVCVLIDSTFVDKNNSVRYMYDNINSKCEFIYKIGSLFLSDLEKNVYNTLLNKPMELNDERQYSLLMTAFNREAKRVLGNTYFDIAIDFSGYSPYWSAIIAATNAKLKLIYQHSDIWQEINHSDPSKQRPRLMSVAKLYKYFDRIVSVSKEVMDVNLDKLSEFYPHNSNVNCVTYARNTITAKAIERKANEPLELINTQASLLANNSNYYKFISIGRLSPEKNHSRLLDAFALFQKKSHVNSVLLIVGDGSEMAKLRKKAVKLNIEHRVLFTGHLNNPYSLLQKSDCFILPSDYEGQGIVLLEALTLGVPCIATDIPAVKSILGDNVGYLADPNPESFCDYMKLISEDKPVFEKFNPIEYQNQTMDEFYKNII